MNNALKELEQIAQRLDVYMHEHGNSAALETAAEAIADELDERDVTVSRVEITLLVDVKHKTKLYDGRMHDEVLNYFGSINHFITDMLTLEENIDVNPDIIIDVA